MGRENIQFIKWPHDSDADSNQSFIPYTTEDALQDLFMSEEQFTTMLEALRTKQNIILQGPPGVGKTWVAEKLAYALMGEQDPTRVRMVQFHQNYSYEDFIQGYRPDEETNGFQRRDGVFYEFCNTARRPENSGKKFVFLIDEINRGNLSKIFGELMMLIEADKRKEKYAIPLTYHQPPSSAHPDQPFWVPDNVYIVGMMNTADRSLAMVDYALRRRFRFISLKAEIDTQKFRDHLASHQVESSIVEHLIERVGKVNNFIANDNDLGDGYEIGHSYFCPTANVADSTTWYENIVGQEIGPLLEEYWFESEDRQKYKSQMKALSL